MTLGNKLKILRKKTSMTLTEQSKILKVSVNSVYRWEHDLTVPRRPVLKMLADHYGVPVDWLLSDKAASFIVSDVEQDLLLMFRKLRDGNRYKAMGYIERMCVEEQGKAYNSNSAKSTTTNSSDYKSSDTGSIIAYPTERLSSTQARDEM